MSDVIDKLRTAAANVEKARKHGIAEYLAGWEHITMREVATLLDKRIEREELESVVYALGQMLYPDPRASTSDVLKNAVAVYKKANLFLENSK